MALGINCKLYYNAGTYGSPTWTELEGVSDLNDGVNFGEANASTRGSPVAKSEPYEIVIEITGKILDDGGADILALEGPAFARTSLDILVLDGAVATNGSRGLRFDAKVHNWSQDQGLGTVLYRDFTLKPCLSSNQVKTVAVSGGSAAYTTIS